MGRRHKSRHGIVLLVVLSLLVIFTLMGVTFVVVTGHYSRASRAHARYQRTGEPPSKPLEVALMQVLRDTRDGRSSLQGQSLLYDLYGNDGLTCIVTRARMVNDATAPTLSTGLIYINYAAEPLAIQPFNMAVNTNDDYYNGRVVTILDSMWHKGGNRIWGSTGVPSDVGTPGTDDVMTFGHRWQPGGDLRWGIANTDDNGDGITDDRWEAGWFNSDDVLLPGVGHMLHPGNDGAWGRLNIDDDGDGILDNSSEAGFAPSDDGHLPAPGFSSRVVDSGAGWLIIEASDADVGRRMLPALGTRFVINGAPFNGTGAGAQLVTRNIAGTPTDVANLDNSFLVLRNTIPYVMDNLPGVGGFDDDGDGIVDNTGERGWPGSDDAHVALLPHLPGFPSSAARTAALQGGVDESYDTFGFQNMFLAMVPPDLESVPEIIPSFHRPALVNYWFAYAVRTILGPAGEPPNLHREIFADVRKRTLLTGPQQDALLQLKRRFIFRPLIEDHPNFTGSNPNIIQTIRPVQPTPGFSLWGNQLGGVWDVDNDGDGVPDSIWIDFGMPPQTSEDGRLYKPLAAILIKDLDGLLNLNAHDNQEALAAALGNRWSYHPGPDGEWGVAGNDDDGDGVVDNVLEAGGGDDVNLASPSHPAGTQFPRGSGVGPAEISLSPLFNDLAAATAATESQRLINGRYLPTTPPGRNDNNDDFLDQIKRHALPPFYPWAPGADGAWGVAGSDDNGDGLTDNPLDAGWPGSDDRQTGYGSPPDSRGIGGVLLDHVGQPVMAHMGLPGETVDDPYELLLGGLTLGESTANDRPYTISELERLLRSFDLDTDLLSDRIMRLAPNTFSTEANRRHVTVHSSHVPVVNVTVPQAMRSNFDPTGLNPSGFDPSGERPTLRDLYLARFTAGGTTNIPAAMAAMYPLEFAKGEPFNVNRPVGNGRDDNAVGVLGHNVTDEPSETVTGETAWVNLPPAFNHQNDSARFVNSRHLYVRHLYGLLMMLADPNPTGGYVQPTTEFPPVVPPPDTNRAVNAELQTRRFAQWAVNVMDFRDPDSIMTGFEYDASPFDADGWNVDGWITMGPGQDGRWGIAGVDDNGDMVVDNFLEAGWPGSDDFDDRVGLNPGADGGWGNAATDDDSNGILDDISEAGFAGSDDVSPPGAYTSADRRVVWGAEYPELLLTETKAFHDRRVKDTIYDDDTNEKRKDSMGMAVDATLDQYRLPQGSLFMEFYCPKARFFNASDPRFPNHPTVGEELYTVDRPGGVSYLDIGRMAPAGFGQQHPIWRVAISEAHQTGGGGPVSPLLRSVAAPDSTSFDPAHMDMTDTVYPFIDNIVVDRVIWFANVNPTTVGIAGDAAQRIYYNRLPYRLLRTGGYAALGPRVETRVGSKNPTLTGTPPWPPTYEPSDQRIRVESGAIGWNSIAMWRNDNATANPDRPNSATTGPVVPMICAADPPSDWTNPGQTANLGPGAGNGIGISLSEPLPFNAGRYYPEPTAQLNAGFPRDSWHDSMTATGSLPDIPFDSDDPGSAVDDTWPLVEDAIQDTGTTLDYKSAFLQRLANPLEPFHPELNPYITVDWMPIDLTVFNGEDTEPAGWDPANPPGIGPWDPDDPTPDANPPFETRERGAAPAIQDLWSQSFVPPATAWLPAGATDFFVHNLTHSLGWLNASLDTPRNAPAGFIGDPTSQPFPWMALNNRPFASPLELMMVPASSPSRLLHDYSLAAAGVDPYDASSADVVAGVPNLRAPFGHLLNFFHGTVSPPDPTANRARLYELFDYLHTPSPFAGTERWFNPSVYAAISGYPSAPPSTSGPPPLTHSFPFRPPYNSLSRFRDPGRVNINTMPYYWTVGPDNGWGNNAVDDNGDGVIDDVWEAGWPGSDDIIQSRVWEGITKGFPAHDPRDPLGGAGGSTLLGQLLFSRRGVPSDVADVLHNPRGNVQNPLGFNIDFTGPTPHAVPTRFGNPFRTAASSDLMPRVTNPVANPADYLPKDGVEATLLRPNPFFVPPIPMFNYASTSALNDTTRNPAFAYQGISRLANLLTTHSNVFAVWITVGYFEVEANPGGADAAHPDGFRLGQEVGALTGEVKRHRGFYIIDRSIPVGFAPGENHNVERAILLRRVIE